ncbi:hypothetical protein ZWY2020_051647 [Hordeum vulgare]|nr:hypothetical protein ZWY2020_051647 [Hordeum vulgare]
MTFPMATSTTSTAAAALRLLPRQPPHPPALSASRPYSAACPAPSCPSPPSISSRGVPVPIRRSPPRLCPTRSRCPPRPGSGVFNRAWDLQFLEISRNVRASIEGHRRKVPADLFASVKCLMMNASEVIMMSSKAVYLKGLSYLSSRFDHAEAEEGFQPCDCRSEKEALAAGCGRSFMGLLEYFKEVSGHKMQIDGGETCQPMP